MQAGRKVTAFKISLLLIIAALTACAPTPTITPTPSPTVTNRLIPKGNENSAALEAAQTALTQFQFGFAPLLQQENTRLVIQASPEGELVRLAYPPQPANPADWLSMDSFVLTYAVRSLMLTSPQVRRIAVGKFDLAVPIPGLEDSVTHYAAWVRFVDGSEAIVDLSPLATNFAARHRATEFITDPAIIESQFNDVRTGVPLNILQPMTVVSEDNEVYYLLAKVQVLPDRYRFSLCAHLTQTATPIQPLQLTRGSMATFEISRADFETVRQGMIEAGPTIFNQRPELLSQTGNDDPKLARVLAKHVPLLWHMVTKLEHQQARPAGTPAPPATSTPTPTPTPTRTPTPLPLLTS